MDFAGAIKDGLRRYARFDGVSSRPAFWYWRLFVSLLSLVGNVIVPVSFLISLGLLIPDTAISIRRSRDSGFSAWFQLLWLVPVGVLFAVFPKMVDAGRANQIDFETATNEQILDALTPVLALALPALFTALAVQLFFFITWLMPSKTAAQGNRLVKQ